MDTLVVNDYKIVRSTCPDLVLKGFERYDVLPPRSQVQYRASSLTDSTFAYYAGPEQVFLLNVKAMTVDSFHYTPVTVNPAMIDSAVIVSRSFEHRKLEGKPLDTFVKGVNQAQVHSRSFEVFDSAFASDRNFRYRIELYSNGTIRSFYGTKSVALDSSGWLISLRQPADTAFFHKLWNGK